MALKENRKLPSRREFCLLAGLLLTPGLKALGGESRCDPPKTLIARLRKGLPLSPRDERAIRALSADLKLDRLELAQRLEDAWRDSEKPA